MLDCQWCLGVLLMLFDIMMGSSNAGAYDYSIFCLRGTKSRSEMVFQGLEGLISYPDTILRQKQTDLVARGAKAV